MDDFKRGTYSFEMYENTFSCVGTGTYYVAYIRGGKGVVYKNAFTGIIGYPICLADYKSFNINDLKDTTSDSIYCKTYPTKDQINNLYLWNNTLNGNPITDGNPILYVQDRGLERDHIQNGRDYFEYAMPGYEPYTYPHPLVK